MRLALAIAALLALATPLAAQSSSSSSSSAAVRSSSSTGSLSSSSGAFTGVKSSSSGIMSSSSSSSVVAGLLSSSSGSASGNVSSTPEQANDLAVLNTALTVAHLEASFFGCQLYPLNQTFDFCANQTVPVSTFSVSDFQTAGFNASVFEAFETVALQSVDHVDLLTQAIDALSYGVAVPRCSAYNYQRTGSIPANSNQTISTFIAGAQSLSGSSAAIHLGALRSVTSADLMSVVAGLAAIESRHNTYFYEIMGFAPFSNAGFDSPTGSVQASLILQSWMLRCSDVTFTLPTVRPYGIALNTANITRDGFAQGVIFSGSLSQQNNLTYTREQRTNDVLTLKYLLFIEEFQQAMFNASQTQWNETAWVSAGYNSSVVDILTTMSSNEDIHASTLTSMLSLYDDTSIANTTNQCIYNFTSLLVDADRFMSVFAALKQWSTSAYVGASTSLTDTDLQQLVGSITTIEARHSAIVNLIASGNKASPLISVNQSNAFPESIDALLTPGDAIDQLRQFNFLISCGQNLTLPAVAPFIIPQPINNATSPSSSSTGAFFNGSSSSTGVAFNGSSSSGAFFNGSSSTGVAFNRSSSSSGALFNASSSTGVFNSSSSSGVSFNTSSSSGVKFNTSSSSGVFVNATSSTGVFNSSTGLPSSSSTVNFTLSSTGATNQSRSSSSSSSPFFGLSSSVRSSSSGPSSSSSSTGSVASSSSAGGRSSSSSSASFAASSSSSAPQADSSSSLPDFLSSTGEDLDNPGLNSASDIQQHVTMAVAMTIAAAIYVM